MKKLTLILIAVLGAFVWSCESDDTADINIELNSGGGGGGNTTSNEIGGTQTVDLTLEIGQEYILTEALIMTAGTTLTIPAGVVIKANPGAGVYIAIAQDARIVAEGTSTTPVVLTSNVPTPSAGDWGGLIILGRAPINSVAGGNATSTSEIGGLPYGGSNTGDNSGILRYVRVEYSGGAADASSENNGFSFYGVGNGTVVEFIQAFEGKDDGIEFFGGTVNASNISVIGAQDDSVDWTEGFSGILTDVYIEHRVEHDKGIEADGFNTDIGNNSNPVFWSKPTINNLTIIGRGSATGNEAVRLRAGTQGIFNNVIIQGFEEAFDLDAEGNEPTGQGVLDGDLRVNDVTFIDVIVKMKNDTGVTFEESDFIFGDGNGTGTDYDSWKSGWTRN
ncbi:MAG: multidrug transporter [Bacteroidia bacterium]|nr:multidrug transporter [Bacteroidia bacterium]MBT8277204.1 multidrug transporter [Bacteroidia bacterium]NNF30751.1 multidrug transporter [Flavobacteriaceae bacterium]NNJ81455.1 multidrug transporter [Flavobacteriaceae bacterium]NNK54781.1 multidrug transporter [Flavobacteriaceae bacterium]